MFRHPRAPALLFFLIVTLAAAAGLVLIVDGRAEAERRAARREFQQLVGGLGFGPAADLSGCAFSFDPRLGAACGQSHGPTPAGACFCPHHGCSVLPYPPLETGPEG